MYHTGVAERNFRSVGFMLSTLGYATSRAQLNQAMGIEEPVDYDVASQPIAPVADEEQARRELASLVADESDAPLSRLAAQFWDQYGMTASARAAFSGKS